MSTTLVHILWSMFKTGAKHVLQNKLKSSSKPQEFLKSFLKAHQMIRVEMQYKICFKCHINFFFSIGCDLMYLIVPLFVSLLMIPSKHASSDEHAVHTHVLNTLVSIGPQYPSAFKKVLSSVPKLKAKLETAIKSTKDTSTSVSRSGLAGKPQQQPTIKLKMDFSNFK